MARWFWSEAGTGSREQDVAGQGDGASRRFKEGVKGLGPARHRVLHILPDGSPGGGGTAVLGLCRDLMATGNWEAGLVTAAGSPVAEEARDAGIACWPVDFFTSRLDFRAANRLAQRIAAFGPDIVHAHGARAGLPFCLPALRRAGPLVYTVHGFHHARKRLPLRWLGRLAERRILARADAVVFVSDGDRDQAVRERMLREALSSEADTGLPGGRQVVIPNGVDPADLDGLLACGERFELVFAGRAHPQKNPFFMIDIMEALLGSGIRLRMICGGPLEPALRKRIAESPARDSIAFGGALPRREVLQAFLAARLYILPSLWEGLPIAPIEALYSGLPVIGSSISGTREVVADRVHGRLIEGFDAAVWAQAIREILADETLRQRLAAAGRQHVEAGFVRAASSARHEALYRILLPNLAASDRGGADSGNPGQGERRAALTASSTALDQGKYS